MVMFFSMKRLMKVGPRLDDQANSGNCPDRALKSDAEDKSLSNDETPPPTCPRQPPDGVETPSDVIEKAVEAISTRTTSKFPSGWPSNRSRLSYSRSQDPRSEASVKDKIAMFSNDRGSSSDLLEKCGTLPSRITSITMCRKASTPCVADIRSPEVRTLNRRLTKSQDNLDDVVINEQRSYKRLSERPEVVGALESKKLITSTSTITPSRIKMTENKFAFYGSTTALNSAVDSSSFKNVYHRRSSSDDFDKNSHKSNLEYLIEQRKKSMSKLRGLMIPDMQAPIVDLPEIKVQGNLSSNFLLHNSDKMSAIDNKTQKQINKPLKINETWRTNLLPNNIPKYSPAFKRKSLQVYSPTSLSKESTPERKLNQAKDVNSMNKTLSSKPRSSLDLISASEKLTSSIPPAKLSVTRVMKLSENDYKNKILNSRDFSNVEIKICTATEVLDSDNDSAMSSTQSSYRSSASSPLHNLDSIESDSSHLSPRTCHYASYATIKSEISTKTPVASKNCDEYGKQKVRRSMSSDTNVSLSSSAGSAATSGSQASCSSLESSVPDLEKRKVSKTYNTNIDTINRRNIVASAKCRSGRDNKLNSPVIETKFLHEPCEIPSSPNKTSDRLSTLTPSVSAISNKGDNRRRSKMITETDSDSDTEPSVRQRKSEFKNTRLKRNSSLHKNDKNKQSDVVSTTTTSTKVVDEPPQVISERIIKEIKKAGLDDYYDNQMVHTKNLLDRYDKEIRQNSYRIMPKGRESNKTEEDVKPQINGVVSKLNAKSECDLSVENNFDKNVKTLHIVRLKKGIGSGVGLILAGGVDCEAKEVTIHRVLVDSIAERAGLKRGLRVHSINGTTMEGLTHAQSVTVLKEQRSEVVIEIEEESQNALKVGGDSELAESKVCHEEGGKKDLMRAQGAQGDRGAEGALVTVLLEKAGGGAGLGFGLDGGRDSPRGDVPLTVKKLFAGGAAARSGRVMVGAELVSAGGQQFGAFTRTQAWAALKALPAGPVALARRRGDVDVGAARAPAGPRRRRVNVSRDPWSIVYCFNNAPSARDAPSSEHSCAVGIMGSAYCAVEGRSPKFYTSATKLSHTANSLPVLSEQSE
ncbi:Pro-interleukin-16 [Eumeta japonica]|uniref:Pro-interleukin-16 n=1 Tax=Eumeta variegata TaxID=151549 RepID=A0A4C1XAN1_EUMVA|nr:Pro-interleukin-16 [Eumeta japonica]